MLSSKDQIIHALQRDLNRLSKVHNDLTQRCKTKLSDDGILVEEENYLKALVTASKRGSDDDFC